MPALNIAVELSRLGLPLKQALPVAAELGADAVVLDARGEASPAKLSHTGVRQIRKALSDLRLRVAGVTFRTRRGYDTTADLDRRVAATKAAMEFARDLGSSVVVNHVGQVPDDRGSTAWGLLVEVLADLADHGNRCGALLAAETGTESGEQLAGLLDDVPEGLVGVDYNPGNLIAAGHSALEAISALGPRILHVHATDGMFDLARRRGEPASLGQGSADFAAILGALEEFDYRGHFTLVAESGAAAREDLAAGVQFLRRL